MGFSRLSLGFLLSFSRVSRRFLAVLSWVFGVFCGFSRNVSRETFKKAQNRAKKTTKTAQKRVFSHVFLVFSSSQQRNAVLAPGDQKHYRNNTNGNCKKGAVKRNCKGELQRGAAKGKYKEKHKRKQNEEAQREV